ncbi:MAG: hypothetical protein NTW59_03060 [Candidatus Diapherotrites archaeon]|nr:hypothetical protein [Candidatus Diapherotrites archaeon]
MRSIGQSSIRLLLISGIILLFISIVGVFALAMLSAMETTEKVWNVYFFYLLSVAIAAIAVYYIAIGMIGWMLLKKKGKKVSLSSLIMKK